jgi:hypothetical protein
MGMLYRAKYRSIVSEASRAGVLKIAVSAWLTALGTLTDLIFRHVVVHTEVSYNTKLTTFSRMVKIGLSLPREDAVFSNYFEFRGQVSQTL